MQKGFEDSMRIVHIIWALNVGGAESMLVDIVNEQSKAHAVHLIIVNQTESSLLLEQISRKVTIYRVERRPGSRSIFKLFFANLFLWRLKPDVVHCHNHDLVKFYLLGRWFRVKFFLTIHGMGISKENFSKYGKLIAISNSVKKDVQVRSNLLPETVFNGIPMELKKKNKYSDRSQFSIVQIGRLDYHKGQDILLNAVEYLVHSENMKDISVSFIGEGPSKANLERLAKNLNIINFCIFHGVKSRKWIYEHLCEYDLLVQPSRYEGFGLTIAEAIAAKVPVLVSNLEGPMEIIDNGTYGYIFPSENSSDLARRIIQIRKEYGSERFLEKIKKGYHHVRNSYDIKQTAEKYLQQYEKH